MLHIVRVSIILRKMFFYHMCICFWCMCLHIVLYALYALHYMHIALYGKCVFKMWFDSQCSKPTVVHCKGPKVLIAFSP